jgi:hypothetical protein
MRGSFSSGSGTEKAALFFRNGQAEFFHDQHHVFPDFAFFGEGAVA